jgi:hypothetical protein
MRSCTNGIKRFFRGGGRVYLTCLQALIWLANLPLQTIENGARSQLKLTSCTILKNRHLACSTKIQCFCGVGILPAHKRLVENGAKSQLKLTSCTILKNRQDACSTKSEFYCGVGILPARKRLIENGARSQLKLTFAFRWGLKPSTG